MSEHGKEVGKDIAVIGFDDQPFAKELTPPLATVKADAFQLGSVSVEKAYNYLNGIKDDRHLVETRFIPRGSCFVDKRFIKTPETLFVGDTAEIKQNLNAYITERLGNGKEAEAIFVPLYELIDLFEREFINAAADDGSVKAAYDMIVDIFGTDGEFDAGALRLYTLQDNLYVWMFRNCTKESLPYVQKLMSSVKKAEAEASKPILKSYVERTHLDNLFIRDSLMFGGDLKDSYASILKRLCNVGSQTSYLYILENPVEHTNDLEFSADVKLLFKSYCYGAECFNIPESEQRIDTAQAFNNKYLVSDRARILIAADLFSAQTQYGLALLEPVSLDIIDELELITYQLSSAVRTLDILKNLNSLLTETRLALAMANDYKYIYCIDTNDGSYIQYERERTDKDFSVKSRGADFFCSCKSVCDEVIYEDDRILFHDMFSRDSFLSRIDSGELFSFDYRFIGGDTPVYYRLKTIIGTDENRGTVFIGVTDITAAKLREIELKAELFRDPLTGVKNKTAYKNTEAKTDQLIREEICEEFSVFVFDLNDLKKINDSLGHDEGDKYIRSGSRLICETFKHSPVFRIGGDEFAAVLTGNDYEIRDSLKKRIKEQVEANKRSGGVVIAVGSADYVSGRDTCVLEVFKRADKEMYEDKHRLKTTL